MQDFKVAFRLSLPVLGAYWFLGITYGLLASSMGFSIWIPVMMAMIVFSGSVEFIALTMLAGVFHPQAVGTIAGGMIGDKYGRKWVIWFSILGVIAVFLPKMKKEISI